MEDHMNEPIEYSWTDQDILEEYHKWNDKRKVSRIYDIPVAEINKIIKRNEDCNEKEKNAFYNRES